MHIDEHTLTLPELRAALKEAEAWVERPEVGGCGERNWLRNQIAIYKRLIKKNNDQKKESGGDSR